MKIFGINVSFHWMKSRDPDEAIIPFNPARVKLLYQDRGDEESRYDEEYVDADESARNLVGECMKGNHGCDRDGPQSIDVGSVSVCQHVLIPWRSGMQDRRSGPVRRKLLQPTVRSE